MPSISHWTARGATLLILWAPIVLVLTVIQPTAARPPPLYGLTALALALIAERLLRTLFWIPVATRAHGRHRVVPRWPYRGVHAAALGLALWAWAGWNLFNREAPGVASLALIAGGVCFLAARYFRRLAIWGGWFEVHNGLLTLQGTHTDFAVPVGQICAVHRRERDGSFWIETPWEDRNSLVLTRSAQGRYWIEDAEVLLRMLAPAVEVREVKALIGLLSGRRR